MAALAVCPTGAVAEVYSCEIREWVRVNDEDLFGPRQVHLLNATYRYDKETGNAVGDALSLNRRSCSKGFEENAFVTLGHDGSRLLCEIAVYEFKIGREKILIIAVRSHRGQWNLPMMFRIHSAA